MTIASDIDRSGPYNGNGVTTAFNYEFRIIDEAHLRVVLGDSDGGETTLSLGSDYSVTGVGDEGGGEIVCTVAPETGTTITVLREVPFTQETDLENQGAYLAQVVEDALDLAVMRDQQLAEEVGRAIKVPASSGQSDLTLTPGEAGQVVGFDAGGNLIPLSLSGSGNMLEEIYDPDGVKNNAFSSFFHKWMNSGTTFVRTVWDRLRSVTWLEDYGAVGTGGTETDDTAAVIAAVAQAVATNRLVKGNGTYRVKGNIPLFHDARWEGTGKIVREGLGDNLVTNGGFASTATWLFGGTAPAPTISGGKLVFASANGYAYKDIPALTPGKTYRVSLAVEDIVTGAARISLSVGSNPYDVRTGLVSANGTFSFDLTPTQAVTRMLVAANSGTTLKVDDISIREVRDDEWHLSPANSGITNYVYAAASGGSASNDGLTATYPLDTAQHAADALVKWSPLKKGQWGVALLAGVFARIRFPDEGLPSSFPIKVKGPAVSIVPGADFKLSITGRSGNFSVGEIITFSTSGATALLTFVDNAKNVLFATLVGGAPVIGQTVTGGTSGATAVMDYQSPTPLAKIKEGATQSGTGILGFYSELEIQDIEVEDYNGSTSSAGIRVDYRNLSLNNVHLTDCYYGGSLLNRGKLDAKGGFSYDCGYLNSVTGGGHAYRGVFHVKFEIGTQNAGSLAQGPAIKGCSGTVRGQELCTGHLDYCLQHDNDAGVRLLVNSRLNIDGSSFKRITTSATYGTQGSHIDSTSNTVWGTGVDANGRNWSGGAGSTASGMGIDGHNTGNAANPGILDDNFPNLVINTTGNTVIESKTVNVPALNDAQFTQIATKKLRCRVFGNLGGLANTKRLICRLNGSVTNVITYNFSAATVGGFYVEFTVWFRGPNDQYMLGVGSAASASRKSDANESTTAPITMNIEGTVLTAGDSITVEGVEWEEVGF